MIMTTIKVLETWSIFLNSALLGFLNFILMPYWFSSVFLIVWSLFISCVRYHIGNKRMAVFLILFQVPKSIWANIHVLCVIQQTLKIRRNHRGCPSRLRIIGWFFCWRYDLVEVLLVVIVYFVVLFPTPHSTMACYQWSMTTFKDYLCTNTWHIDVYSSKQ